MTKINLDTSNLKKSEREIVSSALEDAGFHLVELTDGRGTIGKPATLNIDQEITNMVARMQTGKPLHKVEDYR